MVVRSLDPQNHQPSLLAQVPGRERAVIRRCRVSPSIRPICIAAAGTSQLSLIKEEINKRSGILDVLDVFMEADRIVMVNRKS